MSVLWCSRLKAAACLLSAAFVFGSTHAFCASPHPESAAKTECASVSSAILGRSVDYCVAFPPGYDASSNKRYPTLYFLHGLFEDEHSWLDRGGEQIWESLTRQGTIGDFIVVLPAGGRTFYVNSADGHDRYEDFFIQEMVPEIDRRYRTWAAASERGISGVSMGGYGALHLAMRHPDVFGSASAHSAALLPKFPNRFPPRAAGAFMRECSRGLSGRRSTRVISTPTTLSPWPSIPSASPTWRSTSIAATMTGMVSTKGPNFWTTFFPKRTSRTPLPSAPEVTAGTTSTNTCTSLSSSNLKHSRRLRKQA